jgi:hypothetical protein
MEKTLNLKFKYTEKEYVEAVQRYYSSPLRIKADMAISIILIILGGYLLATGTDLLLEAIVLASGCLLLLMTLYVQYISPKKVFDREPGLHGEQNLCFTDEGVICQREDKSSTVQWNYYTGLRENKSFFYLIHDKYMFIIIPRRVFSSREDAEEFKLLVREKLS